MATSLDNDSSSVSLSDDGNNSDSSDAVDYLLISLEDDDDNDYNDSGGSLQVHSNGEATRNAVINRLDSPLPHLQTNGTVLSALDLDGGGAGEEDREDEDRELSIRRAFSEDERRRTAPLTREAAARVMEAMRGVAFRGLVPDWAGNDPEERWMGRLRRPTRPDEAATD